MGIDGLPNLDKHLANIQRSHRDSDRCHQQIPLDTEAELEAVYDLVERLVM